jgi:penicillin-binding protein 1A
MRKLKEAIFSLKVERLLSKEQILERYLNEIYLGHGYYGVKAAAKGYFHKSLDELNLKEMAILVGLPRAPSFYDPTRHYAHSISRANIVLGRMKSLGWINGREYEQYTNLTPEIFKESVTQNKAPYAVEYVMKTLASQYPDIRTGGYKIDTTIDLESQKIADASLNWGYNRIVGRIKNIPVRIDENTTAERNVTKLNGALITIEQKTGAIMAMSGGVDYYKSPFNRVTQAKRQIGSSMKPFLYLSAFNLGYSPSSSVADISRTYKYSLAEEQEENRTIKKAVSVESNISLVLAQARAELNITSESNESNITEIEKPKEKIWRPANYEHNFIGLMKAREAVVRSRNLASINLVEAIGIHSMRRELNKLGLYNLPRDLSLALGSVVFSPLEHAKNYTVISNMGEQSTPYIVKGVTDNFGVKVRYSPERKRLIPAKQAYLIIDVMKDVVKRGTGRRAKTKGIEVAGKTGTTNDNRDVWFCGYTPSTQTLVWFGNDDNTQISKRTTGGGDAAPVFGYYYKQLLKVHPELRRKFVKPEGVIELEVDGKKEVFTDISKPPQEEQMMEQEEEEMLF